MSDTFVYTSPEDTRARPLIDALIYEYDWRYAHDFPEATQEMKRFPAALFMPPDGAFVLLLRDSVAIAGGAFMRLDSHTAEFKRIWTSAEQRRQGLGRKVLAELESRASERGYDRVYLTSGFRQPEAHALYLSTGYTPLFDRTVDPAVYGVLPFAKALRPLAEPLDTALGTSNGDADVIHGLQRQGHTGSVLAPHSRKTGSITLVADTLDEFEAPTFRLAL